MDRINFFYVSGSGASSKCTSIAWNGGTYKDGNQGFGGNLGDSQYVPILANGEEICINIVFTGQAASTTFTIYTDGTFTLTPVAGSSLSFATDGSGNANVNIIVTVSGLTGGCDTHPIKINPGISGGDGSSGSDSPHLWRRG